MQTRTLAAASLLAATLSASAALAQTPATPPPLFAVCSACHESTAGASLVAGPQPVRRQRPQGRQPAGLRLFRRP